MNNVSARINKQIDPIWHVIFLDRIWKGLWLGFTVIYLFGVLFFPGPSSRTSDHLFGIFFMLLITAGLIFYEFKQVSYWRQIGERRQMALHDAAPFLARDQLLETASTLQVPGTVRLGIHLKSVARVLVIALLGCLIIVISIVLGAGLNAAKPLNWYLLIFSFFLFALIIVFSFTCFMFLRYQIQIELTEDAITTSYLGQTRSLRWDDALLFAQYPSAVRNQTMRGLAFELSNEQTVVRWSQQRPQRSYFKVQSNQSQKADFNELVGLVNAYVAQRTGLPLLDLGEAEQKRTS